MFCKKGVLRDFAKPRTRPATLLKKRLWHWCFPVDFAKFLGRPYFPEHLRWLHLMKVTLNSIRENAETQKTIFPNKSVENADLYKSLLSN